MLGLRTLARFGAGLTPRQHMCVCFFGRRDPEWVPATSRNDRVAKLDCTRPKHLAPVEVAMVILHFGTPPKVMACQTEL